MYRPTITVAIPSYNKEAVITRCIESALQNKDDVDDIILVDNCSTDRTFSIAKRYEPNIFCVRNESNLGMSGNFNRCIELCKTDWLMILHADDELLTHAISKYREFIKKYPTMGIIHADSYSVVEGKETTRVYTKRQAKEFYTTGVEALSCPYGVCSSVMIKREAYDKLGHFITSSLSSDAEMWARVASRYPAGYINYPTVTYYSDVNSTGPQSLIKRKVKDIKADWDDLTNRITQYYPKGLAREEYLKKTRQEAPGNYFAIVKANLRAKNWRNVFDGLKLIIVDNGDLWPLIKIVMSIIWRRFKLILAKLTK